MFHFKGHMIITWQLHVQMKHTETNGCMRMCDCHLFSLWNQRCPRPKNLLLLWRSKRCMFVKYWFRKLKDILLCMTVCWKNTAIRVWKRETVGKSVQGTGLFLSGANWMVQKMERQAVLFLISLIQMLQFTLICCKIQRCLT